jgi:hypothetical protein
MMLDKDATANIHSTPPQQGRRPPPPWITQGVILLRDHVPMAPRARDSPPQDCALLIL